MRCAAKRLVVPKISHIVVGMVVARQKRQYAVTTGVVRTKRTAVLNTAVVVCDCDNTLSYSKNVSPMY